LHRPLPSSEWRTGSPSATTTIDGKQIRTGPEIGGVIKQSALDSSPGGRARCATQGAPNVPAHHD